MTCSYPTERATEGPCEQCGIVNGAFHLRYHYVPVSHAYQAPVLARCGHPESEHMTWEVWLDAEEGDGIYALDDDWHAFTETP